MAEKIAEARSKKPSSFSRDAPGEIGRHIGTGRHAQANIVWLTIKWSFIIGAGLSAGLFVLGIIGTVTFTTRDLLDPWQVLVPIITLALGYLFGRGKG